MSERNAKRPAHFRLNRQYHVRWSTGENTWQALRGTYVRDEPSPYDKLLVFELTPGHEVIVPQTDITNAHEADDRCRIDMQEFLH